MKVWVDDELQEATMIPFDFWECGKIGINIKLSFINKLYDMFDLTIAEAKQLQKELTVAIESYETKERVCQMDMNGESCQ